MWWTTVGAAANRGGYAFGLLLRVMLILLNRPSADLMAAIMSSGGPPARSTLPTDDSPALIQRWRDEITGFHAFWRFGMVFLGVASIAISALALAGVLDPG